MEAITAREGEIATHRNQGTVKVFAKTIEVKTSERTDLINLTDEVCSFVEATGVADGQLQVSVLHTTAGIFINEWQDALLTDMKAIIEKVVPQNLDYQHNVYPERSDCDKNNAHSHLRNVVLGHSLTVPISEGKLVLGKWQRVIFSEFDGPNQRKVFLQVFGI
ncbi:MAG: YjbQ family protein [Acidobacteria bacterium]|nr:YjbQ family protein [Acidobacteriota bacterium]